MHNLGANIIDTTDAARFSALTLDTKLYQAYLDDTAFTDAQRHGFLGAIWAIMVGFVELGFSVEPGYSPETLGDLIAGEACSPMGTTTPKSATFEKPFNTITKADMAERSFL